MPLQCFRQNVQHSTQNFEACQETGPNNPKKKNIYNNKKPTNNLVIRVIVHGL